MIAYTIKSGLVDEISLDDYSVTHFEAAEIVASDGTRCAVFLEPVGRGEAGWEESKFRDDVRDIAIDLAYESGDGLDAYTLVFDPGRDQQSEESLTN